MDLLVQHEFRLHTLDLCPPIIDCRVLCVSESKLGDHVFSPFNIEPESKVKRALAPRNVSAPFSKIM